MDDRRPRTGLQKIPDPKSGALAVYPTVFAKCDTQPVPRDLDDRIQQLCTRISATDDDGELNRLCIDLQKALREHIRRLREKVAEFRITVEERSPRKGD
jgi:hypothetical protein